ncbi:MAG: glycosyltransferase, partial [Polyangiaceae bacterium]
MARFILNTLFAGGDVIPFLRMGSALRRRGHDVVLVTHAASEEKARAAGLEFEPTDAPGDLEAVMRDAERLSDPREAAGFFRAHVLSRAARECEAVARHPIGGRRRRRSIEYFAGSPLRVRAPPHPVRLHVFVSRVRRRARQHQVLARIALERHQFAARRIGSRSG